MILTFIAESSGVFLGTDAVETIRCVLTGGSIFAREAVALEDLCEVTGIDVIKSLMFLLLFIIQ